jgi:hypothetical protein
VLYGDRIGWTVVDDVNVISVNESVNRTSCLYAENVVSDEIGQSYEFTTFNSTMSSVAVRVLPSQF